MRLALVALLLLPSSFVSPLQAQAKSLAAQESTRLAELEWHATLDSSRQSSTTAVKAKDYRWEGMAIGAGVVGVALALFAHGLCADSETNHGSCTGSTIGGGLLGAGVGAVVGVFLGSFVSKGT